MHLILYIVKYFVFLSVPPQHCLITRSHLNLTCFLNLFLDIRKEIKINKESITSVNDQALEHKVIVASISEKIKGHLRCEKVMCIQNKIKVDQRNRNKNMQDRVFFLALFIND